MSKLSISDLDLCKRVFMRVDFNVPIADGRITDDTRIEAALPSIRYVFEKGGRLILASHLGRPKGKPEPKYSLRPVAVRLGELMQKELEALTHALTKAEKPYVAIVGGAKISDKIDLIENFISIADTILIGGAMAYTFLRAKGLETGKSLVETDKIDLAKALLAKASQKNVSIELPLDHVVAPNVDSRESQVTRVDRTPADRMGLDIGPETVRRYLEVIRRAKTIVWNGQM